MSDFKHPLERLLFEEAEFSTIKTDKERRFHRYWPKYLRHERKLSAPFEPPSQEEYVTTEQEDGENYSLPALNCIRDHMLKKDWVDIESLARQQKAEDWIIWYFDTLKQWLHVGPSTSLPVDKLGHHTRKEKIEIGESIREDLKNLSRKIEGFAPELSKEYSLLRVLEPWCYAEEPVVITGKAPAKSDSDETLSPHSPREILFELRGGWNHIENVVKQRKAYGLEVPIVGPLSVFSDIAQYIKKAEVKLAKEPRERPKYPAWCAIAAQDLWKVLSSCRLFRHASKPMKIRIIEYMIKAYAVYHGLESPGDGWGPKQAKNAAKLA